MTEQEWLQSADPQKMLAFMQGRMSERKLRLIAGGCCRQFWGSETNTTISATLAIIEQLAEAGSLKSTRGYIRVSAGEAVLDCGASDPLGPLSVGGDDGVPQQVAHSALPGVLAEMIGDLGCRRTDIAFLTLMLTFLSHAGFPPAQQAAAVRDIVHGPFRPIRFHASWRAWNGGVCFGIAQQIYQDRMFDQLPILADALEEAGCGDPEILGHCRSGSDHVRGCWVVDALLGKS